MRLLWVLAWLAFAASANPLIADAVNGQLLEERTSRLVKRSRPKCGPKLAASVSNKRSVGFIRFERNVTALGKRMELPKRAMGAFYTREFPNIDEPIVPHFEAPTATDMSTAVMKTFSGLADNEQYSTGTEGLSGCTTMYIISRKGVYATHWWENVSFSPDDIWREPATQTNRELFQSTVLDMLTSGGRFHPKLDAKLIEDDWIRAYLIHPTQTFAEKQGDVGYPEQWQEIRTTVGRLVPTLQDQSRWTDIPYEALDASDDRLYKPGGTHGKNLFKYDPAHKLGGGQTQHLAMLWVENKKEAYHHDQW